MNEQLALLPGYLTAHLQLTLAALAVGLAVSLPLGVLLTRVRWLEQPVLGVASVIQTIPSLALLAVMVPLLAAAGASSIGYLPAFLGLVLYSLLPILRNTVTGLAGVDPAYIEAARGVGMTERQRLLRVELPLAMPVIIAGVRTATVWTVGVATLSTPVGAASLGNYIFSGLQTRNLTAVLVGCVAAAVLALALDGLVRLIALGFERRRPRLIALGAGALGVLSVVTLASALRSAAGPSRVVIGSKTFTEQYILSDVLAGQIRRETKLPTEAAQSLGSTVVFDALRSGEVDAYVDYTGTIWTNVLHREETATDRDEVLAEVTRALRDEYGVTVVGPLGFENAYALAMRRADAARRGIRTIRDLAGAAPNLSLGADYEFLGRPEWRALESAYGLRFRETRSMDSSLMYQAVAQREVDVISAFSSDGRIAAEDLVVLRDDEHVIPPYDAIILASPKLAEEHPEVVAALHDLVGTIDGDRMREMNMAVDVEGNEPAVVARRFLDALKK